MGRKFKETVLAELENSELDQHYPFYDGDEKNDVEMADDVWAETVSMDIDAAIKNLNELKEMGANRVYFYVHCDHKSYIFTGVKLEEI